MATSNHFKLSLIFSNSTTGKNLSFGVHGHGVFAGDPDIDVVGEDAKNWWNTSLDAHEAYKAKCDPVTALELVTLQRIEPFEPIVFEYSQDLPIVGTDSSQQYSAQAGPLISLRCAKRGRSFRNRCYLPPVAEDQVDNPGKLTDAVALDIAKQFESFLASLAVDNFVPEVWSPALTEGNAITQIKCDTFLRTQRRRQKRAPEYQTA